MIKLSKIKGMISVGLFLLSILTYGQNEFNLNNYVQINKNGEIDWPIINRNGLYYLKNDNNQLADSIFKFTYEDDSFIKAYYSKGECIKKIDYYSNGNKRSELFYKNNKVIDGVHTFYYDTGEKKSEKNFQEGHEEGATVNFYRSGKISGVLNYYNGKLNGKIITFYENGELSSELMVKNGKKRGLYIEYYENGNKALQQSYLSTFKLGNGCTKLWYQNGKLAWEVCYDEGGIKNGIEKAFDERGNLKYQKEWNKGEVILKKKFGSLDNLWLPNRVEGFKPKMQYFFDNDE